MEGGGPEEGRGLFKVTGRGRTAGGGDRMVHLSFSHYYIPAAIRQKAKSISGTHVDFYSYPPRNQQVPERGMFPNNEIRMSKQKLSHIRLLYFKSKVRSYKASFLRTKVLLQNRACTVCN